jgi:ferredoxin
MKRFIYLKDVVTLHLSRDKCIACGMCLMVCPHEVFGVREGLIAIQNRDACMECGACAMNCPAEAISVQSGVGCAAAVINSMFGRESSSCCCVIEPGGTEADPSPSGARRKTNCC